MTTWRAEKFMTQVGAARPTSSFRVLQHANWSFYPAFCPPDSLSIKSWTCYQSLFLLGVFRIEIFRLPVFFHRYILLKYKLENMLSCVENHSKQRGLATSEFVQGSLTPSLVNHLFSVKLRCALTFITTLRAFGKVEFLMLHNPVWTWTIGINFKMWLIHVGVCNIFRLVVIILKKNLLCF